MKLPHKITVTLQSGEAVEVRKPSNRELLAFYQYVLEQRREAGNAKAPAAVSVDAPVQYGADDMQHFPWLISRVTGKSVVWLNQLGLSDMLLLLQTVSSFFQKDHQLLSSLSQGNSAKLRQS